MAGETARIDFKRTVMDEINERIDWEWKGPLDAPLEVSDELVASGEFDRYMEMCELKTNPVGPVGCRTWTFQRAENDEGRLSGYWLQNRVAATPAAGARPE